MKVMQIVNIVRARGVKLPLLVVVCAGCLAASAPSALANGSGGITGTVTSNAASPTPIASICVAALNASTGIAGRVHHDERDRPVHDLQSAGWFLQAPLHGLHRKGLRGPVLRQQGRLCHGDFRARLNLDCHRDQREDRDGSPNHRTVTNNAASPAPLAKMCVAAQSSPGLVTASAITNASGQYRPRSYQPAHTRWSSTIAPVATTSRSTTPTRPVTAPLAPCRSPHRRSSPGSTQRWCWAGKVTGLVTNNAVSPAPLANICVSVLTPAGTFVAGVTTPASGQYSIAGVPAGTKKVVFSQCQGGDFVPQYYNNKPSLAAADGVPVTAGQTNAGISAKMVPAGKISGTVTNAAAAPLAHVCVNALNAATGAVIRNASTNAQGQYTIGTLAAGSYKVQFVDCGQQGYNAQYYKNQATFGAANPVSVTSGVVTTGIGAKLVHP